MLLAVRNRISCAPLVVPSEETEMSGFRKLSIQCPWCNKHSLFTIATVIGKTMERVCPHCDKVFTFQLTIVVDRIVLPMENPVTFIDWDLSQKTVGREEYIRGIEDGTIPRPPTLGQTWGKV